MTDALRNRMFDEGDSVRVVGPLAENYRYRIGIVRTVRLSGGIYRYNVEFEDGEEVVFFGFEMRHVNVRSASG